MSASIELTLKELLQMALGTPKLTKFNISLLHSLVDLLLKKLDCADETVAIGAYEATCLQRILDKSQMSALPLNDERVELISKKLDLLLELEKRIVEIENKLNCNLQQLRNFQKAEKSFIDIDNCNETERECEELNFGCGPENDIACSLLQNPPFLMKLMRRVNASFIEHVFDFEKKIEELSEEIFKFLKRAKREYEKICMLSSCRERVFALRARVEKHALKFIGAMEEVQDILDYKLDKLHLPALKRYVGDNVSETMAHINKLIVERSCPRASVVLLNQQCVSCGYNKACIDEFAHSMPILPDSKARPTKLYKKYCACDEKWLSSGSTIHKHIASVDVPEKMARAPSQSQSLSACQFTRGQLDLIMGTNGQLFRKG